jgi:hypothetical protein
MDRIGYYYIYERLEESGAFDGHRQTSHQSVRAIPFELAIAKISLQNAKIV